MSTRIEFIRDGIVRVSSVQIPALLESYVTKNGWALVPVKTGMKCPKTVGWNERENCIRVPEIAHGLTGNVGLAHAYCDPPTAALDIDRLDDTRLFLFKHGIDLDVLLNSADSVGISSGRPNRAKLLFTLSSPLATLRFSNGAFELRCATQAGLTVQDLLPPSLHPDGQHYRWVLGKTKIGTRPPPIPESLLTFWHRHLTPTPVATAVTTPTSGSETILRLIAQRDPDSSYDDWIRIGMAIHHETGGSKSGLAIWDEWSASGTKYKGTPDLEMHWQSFRSDGPNLATLASLQRDSPARPDDFSIVSPAHADTRPVIRLVGGELHNNAAQCEAILRPYIYVRDRSLVRVGGVSEMVGESNDGIRRDGTQAVIIPATMEYLRRELNQLAKFETYRRREQTMITVDCPKDLATNIAGQGDWVTFRRLDAIARAPFIRSDGSVCEVTGYDPDSKVFYAPNADFPSMIARPSHADAKAALASLLEPFDEFPFCTDAARSAFVSNILTEAVRASLDTSPAFFYTAPTAGTGKTLLSEMPSRIVHGCAPSLRPWAEANEELRKNLLSSLLAGDPTIGFDNLPNGIKIRSPALCMFLTADIYSDRKLGASEVRALPNRTVVFLTGNNITPSGDLARRAIVVRLDADTDRLRDRTFRCRDLRGHIAARRPALLVAALTIVRAYLEAGDPVNFTPLPSFERWSVYARSPLLWLGMPDPVATQMDETDDEAAPLANAFKAIAESAAIGEREFLATELAAACGFDPEGVISSAIDAAGCSNPTNSQRIGYWLRDNRDKIAGGWKLQRGRPSGGLARWTFRASKQRAPDG